MNLALVTRKAQSEVLSKIVVVLILLALSGVAYVWGSNLMEANEIRTEAENMRTQLHEFRQKITEVVNSGNNSARFIDIALAHGTLQVQPGEPCSGNTPDENMIKYSISSRNKFVPEGSWSLLDSVNRELDCNSEYENSTSGVLIGKSNSEGDFYNSDYALWFRYVNQTESGRLFLINMTTSATNSDLILTAGSHQLRVKSTGTTVSGNYVYTEVEVSEV